MADETKPPSTGERTQQERDDIAKARLAQDELNKKLGEQQQKLKKINEEVAEYNRLLADQRELQKLGLDLSDEEIKKLEELRKGEAARKIQLAEQEKAWAKLNETINKGISGLNMFTGIDLSELSSGIGGIGKAFIGFAKTLSDARAELGRTTGFTKEFSGAITGLVERNSALGFSIAESTQAMGELNSNYYAFLELDRAGRDQLGDTIAAFTRLGVSAADSAAALDVLRQGFGESSISAGAALKSLDELSQAVMLPTSVVVKDLATLGPKLAKYGSDGKKVFADLQKSARRLGMTASAAFDISDMFDTFEGAADIAGKLNAQLGLRLNSVTLMQAKEGERIEMLREEFKLRGTNFKELRRREKQAIAEIMGVDVNVAEKLFGDPLELKKFQKESAETAKRSEAMTSITQKLTTAMERLFISLEPVATVFTWIMEKLAWFISNPIVGITLALVAATIALSKSFLFIKASLLALLPIQAADQASKLLSIKTLHAQALASKAAARAALAGIAPMLGMAAAILGIGAGIGLAAWGVSTLVEGFKGLGDTAWPAVAGIVAFGGAIFLASLGMAAFAKAGWLALVPILAVGAAAVGIGYAVSIAAKGMAKFMESMTEKTAGNILGLAGAIGALAAALLVFTIPGILAAASMGLLALALSAVGASLGGIRAAAEGLEAIESIVTVSTKVDKTKLAELENIMVKIGEITNTENAESARALNNVAEAIEKFGKASSNLANTQQSLMSREIVMKVGKHDFGKVTLIGLESVGVNLQTR